MTTTLSSSEQRPRVRLCGEDVERGAREPSGPKSVEQRLLVDQLPARGVDQVRARLHLSERFRVDAASGLVRERQVERQEVGGGQDLVRRLGPRDPELPVPILGDERVVGDHVHPETDGAACDLLADPPEPQNAEGLALQLDPAVRGALPPTLLE